MSYSTISIQERNDPTSVSMKYIIRNLGINIRPGKWIYNKSNNQYTVNLNAVVPNEISPIRKSTKSVYYIFKNIGEIVLDKNMKRIQSTPSSDIEKRLQKE